MQKTLGASPNDFFGQVKVMLPKFIIQLFQFIQTVSLHFVISISAQHDTTNVLFQGDDIFLFGSGITNTVTTIIFYLFLHKERVEKCIERGINIL